MTSQDTFGSPAVYITENGFSQTGPLQLEDEQRSGFYRDTISEVAKGTSPPLMSSEWTRPSGGF